MQQVCKKTTHKTKNEWMARRSNLSVKSKLENQAKKERGGVCVCVCVGVCDALIAYNKHGLSNLSKPLNY